MMATAAALALLVATAGSPDEARLAAGEILVEGRPLPGSDVPQAVARAVVDAPPEKVWAVVSDCARYQSTMPGILESKLVSSNRKPDGSEIRVCRVVTDLPFPFDDLVSVTRGVHVVEPGRLWQRSWTLVEGDYERNNGSWRVEPFGTDGRRSLVTYIVHAKPKMALPTSMIVAASHGKLRQMMKNLREQLAQAR